MDGLIHAGVRQPFSGTDVAAFAFALLAGLYLALWARDRERGVQWLALSFALWALYVWNNAHHLPTGPYTASRPWAVVATMGITATLIGLVDYLQVPLARRRWLLPLMLAPSVILLVVLGLGLPVLRSTANAIGSFGFLVAALLCAEAARREPGAGHALVGLALLSIPGIVAVALLVGADSTVVRYLGLPGLLILGLTLLTTSLLRRRRALEQEVARRQQAEDALTRLNASLEDQVEQRTADLQHMIAGLESFNRSVSHDLRGPLGGIAGLARAAHTALEQGDTGPARRMLPEIARQAESSTELVGALLELARVGDAGLQRRPTPLREVVDDAVRQIRLSDPAQVVPPVQVSELPVVAADAELLRPVFVNLLSNACKFTARRERARIEVGAMTGPDEVTVYVRDNGIGFDTQAASRLFQPFVRLHGSRYTGQGVGLSIVRRAVERHGGRVWAEAAQDQGACFYFTLPRAPAAA